MNCISVCIQIQWLYYFKNVFFMMCFKLHSVYCFWLWDISVLVPLQVAVYLEGREGGCLRQQKVRERREEMSTKRLLDRVQSKAADKLFNWAKYFPCWTTKIQQHQHKNPLLDLNVHHFNPVHITMTISLWTIFSFIIHEPTFQIISPLRF